MHAKHCLLPATCKEGGARSNIFHYLFHKKERHYNRTSGSRIGCTPQVNYITGKKRFKCPG